METKDTLSYFAITVKLLAEDFRNLLYVAKKQDVGQISLTKEGVKFCLRNYQKLIQTKKAARLWQLTAAP